jgi:sortase A
MDRRLYTTVIWYKQQSLLNEWEEEMKNRSNKANTNKDNIDVISNINGNYNELLEEPSDDAVNSFIGLNELFSEIEADENENSSIGEPAKSTKQSIETIGVIKIEKIKANLPIMEGATSRVLKVGVGKLVGTSNFGEIGNTALSAHRSHSYGQNFNRLNEVEEGDFISITTMDAVYNYEVFNIFIVEPSDVSVLKKSKTESILTLITCHPLYTATHRLIVQAKLLPEE